jgi:hypothetical protein
MLAPLAASGGMPELLAAREVMSVNGKGRLLSTGVSYHLSLLRE